MKLFSGLYDKTLSWSKHRRAPWLLGGLSFAESSFFPIPPDVMLVPMTLATPRRAVFLATLTTLASVAGGILGYLIGLWAFEFIEPILHQLNYWHRFETVNSWFDEWGVLAIFIAGFSPVPYKLFTIAAGVIGMALLPFVLASLVGRGGRFFLVALLIRAGGETMEHAIRKNVERIGWASIGLMVIAFLAYRIMH